MPHAADPVAASSADAPRHPAPTAAAPVGTREGIGPVPHDPDLPFGSPFGESAASESEAVGTLPGLPAEQPELEAELETDLSLWAVVFAGGIGSRFWPLSTPERPKQLLALVDERPLIAETVARLAPTIPAHRVLVLTSADIAPALHAAIPEVPEANMLVEPRPMGTAAALAWGAHEVARRAGRQATLVAMHADLAVGYPQELRGLLRRAAILTATERALIVVGTEPTRPETGFGYLVPGDPLEALEEPPAATGGNGSSAPHGDPEGLGGHSIPSPVPRARMVPRRVVRYVEKPGPILAEALIGEGAYWSAGIFVCQAGQVLDALAERTPELSAGLAALAAGKLDRFAGLVQSVSVERGLLERSADLLVLPGEFGWDDVGTWASLRRVRELDDTGNGVWGAAHLVDAASCVVHADGGTTVVLYGVSGMLVVSRPGLTFVTTLDRAAELRPLLDQLPDDLAGRTRREPLL